MNPRPNIILITTDQQRGDCLGCDSNPALETPYLDELAAGGCRFQHAYTAVPSCIPARAAILTGMDQWNHGRLAMCGDDYLEFPATLPGELTRAGYQTRAVGKMHFMPQRAHYGFEHMVLDESARRHGDFISDYHQWFEEAREGRYDYRDHSIGWNSCLARPTHLPEHLHPTYWTASESIRFLKNRDPLRPFFLWMSFARPHSPYDAPKVYFDMYDKNPDLPPPAVGDWESQFDFVARETDPWRGKRSMKESMRARAGYYGNITFIDHQIGRVLYELEQFNRLDYRNTLVIFTSDHGDMLGDHHHWRKSCGLEGAARIPFIVCYPPEWDFPVGQVYDQPVELRDVMPAILDAVSIECPPSVDGRSLLDIPRGKGGDWRDFIHGEHNTGDENGSQYVTDGREKYIWFHHTGKELFFDLAADPRECHNLAGQPGMESRIELWRKRLADTNEKRGDKRGRNGKLVPITGHDMADPALSLTPNYFRWKKRGDETMRRLKYI